MPDTLRAAQNHLVSLYGEETGRLTFERLQSLLERYRTLHPLAPSPVPASGVRAEITERDSILITYPDQLSEAGIAPLRTLADFYETSLARLVTGIHLLPFYPSSSDDGFSVMDYRAVNPDFGTWDDVGRIGRCCRLMFDAVINHVSSRSEWFRAFLRGDERYRNHFIAVEGDPDVSAVVRPRALPLLTEFDTALGRRKVWTTFSADQIDLNYRSPDVLLEIVDLLLFYVSRGAQFLRLDAIAYLWKEIGSRCIHLAQTHRIIQLFRAVLDEVAPHVLLITETNVPHADNISYFGDGHSEAHLAYNFALPPLVLHTMRTGDSRTLSHWAASLHLPSDRVTLFNFLASHDGIGLHPVRGLLPDADLDALVQQTLAHGGRVSYKHNPDGSQSPYELNINYFDALSNPASAEPLATQVDRFMAAQAIMLALAGMPGVYFHSLFGSRGWPEGVKQSGHNRAINRQKFDRAAFERELADPASLRHLVFKRYGQLLRIRAAAPAFHPHGSQQVVNCGPSVFGLRRLSPHSRQPALCLINVSSRRSMVEIDWEQNLGPALAGGQAMDRLSGRRFSLRRKSPLPLEPYQALWLARAERKGRS